MTLNTMVYVHDRVDVNDLFQMARGLLGATTETWRDRDVSDLYGAGVREIGNDISQGLPALLSVRYRPDGPLSCDPDACTDQCDSSDDYHEHHPAMWCMLSFDTTYSYRDAYGGCSALHARLLFNLGRWLDARGVRWSWVNEFDGAVHDGCEHLADLAGGGEKAERWFATVVMPAIEGRLGLR